MWLSVCVFLFLSAVQCDHCDGDSRRGSECELQSDRVHQNTVEVEEEWSEHLNCTQ